METLWHLAEIPAEDRAEGSSTGDPAATVALEVEARGPQALIWREGPGQVQQRRRRRVQVNPPEVNVPTPETTNWRIRRPTYIGRRRRNRTEHGGHRQPPTGTELCRMP